MTLQSNGISSSCNCAENQQPSKPRYNGGGNGPGIGFPLGILFILYGLLSIKEGFQKASKTLNKINARRNPPLHTTTTLYKIKAIANPLKTVGAGLISTLGGVGMSAFSVIVFQSDAK